MPIYRLVTAILIGIYLISPSLAFNWEVGEDIWYSPYLIWLALIALSAFLEQRGPHDEH